MMDFSVNKIMGESTTSVMSNGVVVCNGFYQLSIRSSLYFNLAKILTDNKFRFLDVDRTITEDESFVFTVKFKINTKSKCHKDDTYSEQFGRDLAEDRNAIKAIDKSKRIVSAIERYLVKEALLIHSDVDSLGRKLNKMDEKIKVRCGSYILTSNKGNTEATNK